MRVLLVAHIDAPWTPHYGQFFAARGNSILVLSFSPGQIKGVTTIFVGAEPFDPDKRKYLFLTRVPRIRRIIRDFKPDVVMAPYLISNGLTAALSWKGPLMVSARGTDVLPRAGGGPWARQLSERLIRYVCGRAGVVHTVASNITQRLVDLGVPESRIVQFPTGVNAEQFYPAPDMPRPGAAHLICTRKHEPVYDIRTIITSLVKLRMVADNFHCTFVGGGRLLDVHRQQAMNDGIGDRVSFLGHVPHDQLPSLLRQADVYLSSSRSDGTSSSLLEAMASGLLPIVTRIEGNLPWITEGHNGLMFDPGATDELCGVLRMALSDSELRGRAFEQNVRRIATEANMKSNMERLVAILESMIAENRPKQ